MSKTYYHVTTASKAQKILKTGLKPKIGENSKIMEEENPAIYLCRRKDIHYWRILLGRDTVLKVTVHDDSEFEVYHYSDYDEWLAFETIPASQISIVDVNVDNRKLNKVMTNITITNLYSLSAVCEACARYYEESTKDVKYIQQLYEKIRFEAVTSKATFRNIDSKRISKLAVRRHLKQMGNNGMFTLCDMYKMENKRLYEKLIEYKEDDLTKLRLDVYKLITTKLAGCLDVNTGGWTG